LVAAGVPSLASAAPRSFSITVTPPAATPVLGQPTPPTPEPYTEAVVYDPSTGTITASHNGTQTIVVNAGTASQHTETDRPGFGDISLSHCAQTPGSSAPQITLGTDDYLIPSTGPLPTGFAMEDSDVPGSIDGVPTLSPDGSTLTMTWSDQNLRNLNLTCAAIDGQAFNFDGFNPIAPSTLFDAKVDPRAQFVSGTGTSCPEKIGRTTRAPPSSTSATSGISRPGPGRRAANFAPQRSPSGRTGPAGGTSTRRRA
jgi:hypothetical protein